MAKVAVITGGMGGLGMEMCKTLAKNGYIVATTYSGNEAKREAFLKKTGEDGFKFNTYKCDVASFDSCRDAFAKINAELGGVDVLVNNAGITRDGTFRKMSLQDWMAVIDTNLNSMFNVTKQVLDGMLEKGFGRIINISSINGQKGQLGQTNYSTAKSGVHGFTMALAQEVARKGITVNTIAPGYIATDMVMAVPEEVRNKIIAGIPVGRLGKSEEIAELVRYLASDLSGFMTGAEIAINGGQHMM